MGRARLRGVGYCAHLSRIGDWAFEFALDLARRHGVRLNIFGFPGPTDRSHLSRGRRGEWSTESEQRLVDAEREMRLYYDERLGDFVDVGFRLCQGDAGPELRDCLLLRNEYDVLVLPYQAYGCRFGQRKIESIALYLPCPVFLVGPDRPDQVHVNTIGEVWLERRCLDLGTLNKIREAPVPMEHA